MTPNEEIDQFKHPSCPKTVGETDKAVNLESIWRSRASHTPQTRHPAVQSRMATTTPQEIRRAHAPMHQKGPKDALLLPTSHGSTDLQRHDGKQPETLETTDQLEVLEVNTRMVLPGLEEPLSQHEQPLVAKRTETHSVSKVSSHSDEPIRPAIGIKSQSESPGDHLRIGER